MALAGVILSFFLRKNKTLTNAIFIIEALVLMLIVAFRHESIGTDTVTYCEKFLHPNDEINDWGFWLYNIILGFLTKKTDVFIFVTATISFLPVYYSIWKDSRNKCFSLFVFLTMGTTILYYALYFASMRHCFAVGFIMLLVYNVRNNKLTSLPVILLLNVTIGFIHITTFFFIPVFIVYYYLKKRGRPLRKLVATLILVISFILGIGLQDYMQYISLLNAATEGRFDYYLTHVSSSEYMIGTTLPLFMLGVLFILFASDGFKKDLYYVMFLFGICVNNLMVMAGDSSRLTFLFLISACVAIPNFISDLSSKNSLKFVKFGLVLVVLLYYSSKYNHTWNNIIQYDNATYVPYKTNSLCP